MQSVLPHRALDRLILGLVLVVLAAPITYLEVSRPSLDQLRNTIGLTSPKPAPTQTKPETKPTPQATSAPTPAPAPAVQQTPATGTSAPKTATTTTLVHFRTEKTSSSTNIGDIPEGSTVTLRDDSDANWQGVTYQGKNGYIYSSYLKY
jgi:hypothetical protein